MRYFRKFLSSRKNKSFFLLHRAVCLSVFFIGLSFFVCCVSKGLSNVKSDDVRVQTTIIDKKLEINRYRGKKLILFFYSPGGPSVSEAVQLMKDFYDVRGEYNFDIAGICLDADTPQDVLNFNLDQKIPFSVYLDKNHEFSSRHKIKGKTGFFVYSKTGRRIGGVFARKNSDPSARWRAFAGRYLKIGYVPADEPILGIKPLVPLFEGKAVNGKTVNIREVFKNKPVVIAIFSPRCPRCREELDFLNSVYSSGDLKGKFEILAISIVNKKQTGKMVIEKKFRFPVIADPARKIAGLFPSFAGPIPTSFVVGTDGHINAVHIGFNSYLKDVYVMELRKLAGIDNPPLLIKDGYSGAKRCEICHEKEHFQWSLTAHSDAFMSLVRKGREDDMKCVPCHVAGFSKKGGYSRKLRRSKYLKGVQCEACHGAGYESCSAFNKSVESKSSKQWRQICLSCHTEKQSLNFIYEKRFPKILHFNAPDLSSMDRQERQQFIRKYREKKNPFDSSAGYVGAKRCKKCHKLEYEQWEKTVHASVYKTKTAKNVSQDEEFRYNTGTGSPGGYPEPGMKGVQCEACHGPGEKHILKPDEKGQAYIVSLVSACPNCVVEQICRRCHSAVYDPDFNFEKQRQLISHKRNLKSSHEPDLNTDQ